MSSELLPCPFCGGKAAMVGERNGYSIRCKSYPCFAKTMAFFDKQEAIAAWNTRAERTCKNVARNPYYGFECSACRSSQSEPNDYGNDVRFYEWKYCPSCGARVAGD